MHLFDSHCHLDVQEFDADREAVLQHSHELGVKEMLIPAVERKSWAHLLDFCRTHTGLYPALGLHPVYLEQHKQDDIAALEKAVSEYRPVAIGEIGLDYYLKELDRDAQQKLFEAQLCIARDACLPVILHVRKSYEQVMLTLKRLKIKSGIAHAFNGSLQQAQQYIDLGFKLGFGGTMTYDGSRNIHALAKSLPLQNIVLETDAPDMVVSAHRGERNSPEYLPQCLQALAYLRDEDPETVAAITTANAHQALNIP